MLAEALRYLRHGWSVVPAHSIDADGVCTCTRVDCDSPGKHPRVQWAQYQAKAAPEAKVLDWWERWPDANVAVITGRVSGIVVLDVDPRHGGDGSLLSLKPLPDTVTCLTGGGGQHLYFSYPATEPHIGNGAGLMPGIDLRGDGGYVIAPPSRHASGRPYEWEAGYGLGECELADLPNSVKCLLVGYRPRIGVEEPTSEIDISAYSLGAVRIPEGERNATLTRIAGHLLGRGTPLDIAQSSMLAINSAACDPPLPHDELQKILRSIHARQQRKEEALAIVEHQVTPESASKLGNADRRELARALWLQLGVPDVVDWYRLVGGEEVEYRLELSDRDAPLGSSLLVGYSRVRDAVLNYTGHVIPRMKSADWDRYAEQLVRLAREEQTAAMRPSELTDEWLREYRQLAQEFPPEMRRDALRSNPILYNGRLATKGRRMLAWLEATYGERLKPRELGRLLRMGGWDYTPIFAGNTTVAVWLSPPLDGGRI